MSDCPVTMDRPHGLQIRTRSSSVLLLLVSVLLAGMLFSPRTVLAASGGPNANTTTPRGTTVAELVAADPALDGTEVRFVGEAIGEPIIADEGHVWVNVAGQGKLIGVYMSDEQAALIENYGHYLVEGTDLEIAGVFDTSCSMHDGELDVHAGHVDVVSPGGAMVGDDGTWKLYAGGFLLAAGSVMWLVYRYRRRRSL